jgi:hypothetical protein
MAKDRPPRTLASLMVAGERACLYHGCRWTIREPRRSSRFGRLGRGRLAIVLAFVGLAMATRLQSGILGGP